MCFKILGFHLEDEPIDIEYLSLEPIDIEHLSL